ncbi:photosystem II [Salvia divinorum]|uniref:Eukaryotic translation initiation factor 5B n=1 Tax=Salvia divinorum TaxID=28513 RepID=A0ABD1GS51_SALDI
MGHVDAGKTKLLDCIRGTHVQEGEAGGITQQIGATYFPAENIRERTKELKVDAKLNVPGLLVIDTPGHESFTKLRSRGSGLCDLAILVVDLMHGLEPQTIESLNLLKSGNTDFVIALNKVDRLYEWKTCPNAPIGKAIRQQSKDVLTEFNMRLTQVITQFKEQGLNTELYYKNKEMGETYNIVPTSAISGEGIPDLLLLLVQWAQKTMIKSLTYNEEVQCTILEVKVDEGHGTTIDVVLVNGVLREGDQIVVGGMHGPIVTSIRALLTPHPMREVRVKGTYLHHKEIKAAQCIKIAAQGLEHAIPGANLYDVGPNDDTEVIKKSAMDYVHKVMSRIGKSDPIILGVDVVKGIVKIGTPICVIKSEVVDIGQVASIENNHKPVDSAKKGQMVAIKINGSNPEEQQKMLGRHFEEKDLLLSKISRHSLDVLKAYYADEVSTEDVRLLKE